MAVDTFTGIVLLQGTHAVAMLRRPALHVDALSDTRTGGAIMWFGGDAIMAAVMIVLVVGWLRRVDTDRRRPQGLARAGPRRRPSPSTPAPTDAGDDVDDARRRRRGRARPTTRGWRELDR